MNSFFAMILMNSSQCTLFILWQGNQLSTAQTFGTPSCEVCSKERPEIHKRARFKRATLTNEKAEISEAGTSMLLQDAELITSADVKFPSTAYFAGEKLHGWSVVIDVFHGVGHDVANHVGTL